MKRVYLVLGVVGLLVLVSSVECANLPNDIVLFLAFDETSGTDVKDLSIYGNDGVATVDSWTVGIHNGGYEFDGSTTVIKVAPSPELTALAAPMSVGYWINVISAPGQWQAVVEMEAMAGARSNGWKAGFSNANPVFTTYGVKDHTASGTVPAGEWTHVAFVYDGPTLIAYINGEIDSEIPGSGAINVTQSPGVNIGAEAGTPGNYSINAILDDLWISNVGKTQDEIQALMEAPNIAIRPGGKAATTWGALKH